VVFIKYATSSSSHDFSLLDMYKMVEYGDTWDMTAETLRIL